MSTAGSRRTNVVPGAFDAFAHSYDRDFTQTRLGRLLRERVWTTLAGCFRPGMQVLELACGTGEDAVWLARRGVQITATDGSAAMLEIAQQKAEMAGVADRIVFRQLSLQALATDEVPGRTPYDGVLSNFGGLNTIEDWAALAGSLAEMVRVGGTVVLVPMGPICPWEVAWYLLHAQPRLAFRRRQNPAVAQIGPQTIPIWYPSGRQLRRAFRPWFEPIMTASLGLWLPPSYLAHFVDAHPRLFTALNRIEAATSRITGSLGDHYLLLLRRLPESAHPVSTE